MSCSNLCFFGLGGAMKGAPSAKTGSWQESMKGMAPKNCKVPACEGVFPFKCHNRACPNKGAIKSSDDLVLLQMVNPKKADLHMIGGKPSPSLSPSTDKPAYPPPPPPPPPLCPPPPPPAL